MEKRKGGQTGLQALDAGARSQPFGMPVHQGKVRYVACSNHPGWMVADADHIARQAGLSRFVANQVEWNVMTRDVEAECVPACRRFEVGVIPFFPLASGLLTGKYRRGE